jgi:hypothetical protein
VGGAHRRQGQRPAGRLLTGGAAQRCFINGRVAVDLKLWAWGQ